MNISETLPDADPDQVLADVHAILDRYELEKKLSRDEFPTAAQTLARLKVVRKHLSAAVNELTREPSAHAIGTAGLLGMELTGGDEANNSFVDRLSELLAAVEAGANALNGPLAVDGEQHTRQTRTQARDSFLIPALAYCAAARGGLDLANDWEDLDAACTFVAAVLDSASIPRPASGDARRGEEGQGRLRRMIKEAAADEFTEVRARLTNRAPKTRP